MPELEQLEKDLRKALEGVCGERDRIVQEQLAKEEQRLCVVCQVSFSEDAQISPSTTGLYPLYPKIELNSRVYIA